MLKDAKKLKAIINKVANEAAELTPLVKEQESWMWFLNDQNIGELERLIQAMHEFVKTWLISDSAVIKSNYTIATEVATAVANTEKLPRW